MPQESTPIRDTLLALSEPTYRDFTAKLTPTISPSQVIGIRLPILRSLAKKLAGSPEANKFLQDLPHTYLEENHLHGLLIEQIGTYEATITALDRFLPYVDNWATCDTMHPKILGKHLPELSAKIPTWLASSHPYMIRYGIGMRMAHFLDDAFTPAIAQEIASVRSEEYYVNMMIAWFFATALAKQYDAILPILEARQLPPWTHNKTIQKAIESFRISADQKTYLRTLKVGKGGK